MTAITTIYCGATDYRGARITATDGDGNRITVPYPHEEHTGEAAHAVAALALCRQLGWSGTLIGGALRHGYVFVFAAGDKYPIA